MLYVIQKKRVVNSEFLLNLQCTIGVTKKSSTGHERRLTLRGDLSNGHKVSISFYDDEIDVLKATIDNAIKKLEEEKQ